MPVAVSENYSVQTEDSLAGGIETIWEDRYPRRRKSLNRPGHPTTKQGQPDTAPEESNHRAKAPGYLLGRKPVKIDTLHQRKKSREVLTQCRIQNLEGVPVIDSGACCVGAFGGIFVTEITSGTECRHGHISLQPLPFARFVVPAGLHKALQCVRALQRKTGHALDVERARRMNCLDLDD